MVMVNKEMALTFGGGFIIGFLTGAFLAGVAVGLSLSPLSRPGARFMLNVAEGAALVMGIHQAFKRSSLFTPTRDGVICGMATGAALLFWYYTGTPY